MTDQKRLILDANILLRAVFGVLVRILLETYEDSVSFYAPDICFADARKYIPAISEKRRIDPGPGILVPDHLSRLVEVVDRSLSKNTRLPLANGWSRDRSSPEKRCVDRRQRLLREWHFYLDHRNGQRVSAGIDHMRTRHICPSPRKSSTIRNISKVWRRVCFKKCSCNSFDLPRIPSSRSSTCC
jgi:hypothetical protein